MDQTSTQNPSIKPITLTQKAAKKFLEILEEEGKQGYGLRLKEMAGGCSGYKHVLDFSAEANKDTDAVFTSEGVDIHVDKNELTRLAGALIDYVDDLQNPGFRVRNPNIKSSCGCGSSHSY